MRQVADTWVVLALLRGDFTLKHLLQAYRKRRKTAITTLVLGPQNRGGREEILEHIWITAQNLRKDQMEQDLETEQCPQKVVT